MNNPHKKATPTIIRKLGKLIKSPATDPRIIITIRDHKASLGVRAIGFLSNPRLKRKRSLMSGGIRLARKFTVELFMTRFGSSADLHFTQMTWPLSKSNIKSLISSPQIGHFGFLKNISNIFWQPNEPVEKT